MYSIKPNNVLKQIITMFFTADSAGFLRSREGLLNFVQEKESKGLPKEFKVYLYSNCDPNKRMLGYSTARFSSGQILRGAEINFCPFGYLLTHDSDPPNKVMADISRFADFEYNQQIELEITTAYLIVEKPFIGHYTNI